ncbi:hypothetical protein GW17_00016274 [Ensete ventricosum]|nr:hypothetical protein GW17_00016274 [Ensete ventricosum]
MQLECKAAAIVLGATTTEGDMGCDHIGSRGVGVGSEGTSVVGRGGLAVAGEIDIDMVLVLVQHDGSRF